MASLKEPERKIDAPLRMTVSQTMFVRGSGTVLIGRILTGVLRVGDEVVLVPPYRGMDEGTITVRDIQRDHVSLKRAIPGDLGNFYNKLIILACQLLFHI